MNELETSWNATLQAFGKEYEDKVVFDSVFTLLKAKELTNDELIVTIDSLFNIGYIEEDVPTLEYLFNQITNRDVQLTILSEKEYQEKYVNHEDAEEYNFDDSLNPAFTFENFVVGNSNRIAQNASLAVAMKPGESFSPLFIYSNSGLGKTHLLNAIGNFVKGHNKNAHVLYCTSEQFVNEYIASLSNGSMDTFNYKYRHVDVLLVDDIQFIASKESSSEMFFNIINTLQNQKKQIVITSDKPPKDLKGMEKRLVSRFAQGLTITIDTPEFETAKAIIQKKIEIEKVDYPIDDEVFNFMATHFNQDVRELEGSLKRLLFYKLVFGSDQDYIDLNFALQAFQDTYTPEEKSEHLTVDSIKQCVAQYYNLSVAQINSKSRTNNIIIARHIAMYLVRNLIKDISYIQIGKEFGGRDHSTVMKACSKVDKNIKKDPNYRQAIEEIKAKLI